MTFVVVAAAHKTAFWREIWRMRARCNKSHLSSAASRCNVYPQKKKCFSPTQRAPLKRADGEKRRRRRLRGRGLLPAVCGRKSVLFVSVSAAAVDDFEHDARARACVRRRQRRWRRRFSRCRHASCYAIGARFLRFNAAVSTTRRRRWRRLRADARAHRKCAS